MALNLVCAYIVYWVSLDRIDSFLPFFCTVFSFTFSHFFSYGLWALIGVWALQNSTGGDCFCCVAAFIVSVYIMYISFVTLGQVLYIQSEAFRHLASKRPDDQRSLHLRLGGKVDWIG